MEKDKFVNPEAIEMLSDNRGDDDEQLSTDMLFENQPEQEQPEEGND